jgi:hypothetical protein
VASVLHSSQLGEEGGDAKMYYGKTAQCPKPKRKVFLLHECPKIWSVVVSICEHLFKKGEQLGSVVLSVPFKPTSVCCFLRLVIFEEIADVPTSSHRIKYRI